MHKNVSLYVLRKQFFAQWGFLILVEQSLLIDLNYPIKSREDLD